MSWVLENSAHFDVGNCYRISGCFLYANYSLNLHDNQSFHLIQINTSTIFSVSCSIHYHGNIESLHIFLIVNQINQPLIVFFIYSYDITAQGTGMSLDPKYCKTAKPTKFIKLNLSLFNRDKTTIKPSDLLVQLFHKITSCLTVT